MTSKREKSTSVCEACGHEHLHFNRCGEHICPLPGKISGEGACPCTQTFSADRARFEKRARAVAQNEKCKYQFGPDGMGTGPEDPEDPCPQRMRDMDFQNSNAVGL